MPRITVVVPIYNVERYLDDCLESIAGQTVTDLEVLMVEDGSTDGSAAMAERFAERDPRFRLISQPNGGLGNARNNGAAAATGEFLSFVDSDDALPRDAYELLLGALEKTGSDFATGNVWRLSALGVRQARFLARTFERTRLKTHVKRYRPLLADRIVPNKLWRRSFWEEHKLRFPEGVVHEDIPVVLPAQFLARSVDVISEPVYYYRIRGGDHGPSITQRRTELKMLEDRLAAVEHVSEFLADQRERRGKLLYDSSVVADDLRYYLNVLDLADDHYREVFLERVNAFLDGVNRGAFKQIPAIERLKWHLVRRRMLPELLEVLRFQKEELDDTPPVKVGRHWYGDFPFRDDPRLRIPRSVYKLDHDFKMFGRIDDLRCVDGRLQVSGWAYIDRIGAPAPDTQRVSVKALRHGRFQRLRLRFGGIKLPTNPTQRPDVTAERPQRVASLDWSGFQAVLDPRRLRRFGRWRHGRWELFVTVQAGSARRRKWRFGIEPTRPQRAVELPAAGARLRAARLPNREFAVDVDDQWVVLQDARFEDGTLELAGEIHLAQAGKAKLRLVRPDRSARLDVPAKIDGARFSARIPLADLPTDTTPIVDVHSDQREDGIHWDVYVVGTGERRRVGLPATVAQDAWRHGGEEVALVRTAQGDASLVVRSPRATIKAANWTEDGDLELEAVTRLDDGPTSLTLATTEGLEQHAFPAEVREGRLTARLTPARMESLAGVLPIRSGRWLLSVAGAPVMLDPALHERLPLGTVVAHKPFALGLSRDLQVALDVERDLDPDERGLYHQRVLRETVYVARRAEPLRDAVVYSAFAGRQYSDSPRAIHEELVRRDVPLEHLWVVRNARCEVPPTATVLRSGSREHHDALARARYVVFNDHFPGWFRRRPDQTCLQTWHGTPLKRLGLDVSESQGVTRRFQRDWDERVHNWQYVVSPNRFSTPILRRAYAIEGEMLETGLPRNDQLAGLDRDAATAAVRARLGLPDGVRVVLYAPTYRDHVIDARDRYRLEQKLDIDALRGALGEDAVILYRKHHYIVDPVPATADGFVRDVSAYPDGTELMLAADVLVTDYSSMMFDFANTGRPMLFFTYDLDVYAEEIRGFYFDFAASAPGPLLRTSDELASALRDIDAVAAEHAGRYEEFVTTYCEFDDGRAAERVVDRVFEEVSAHTAGAETRN